eukprot:2109719-Rhodomonas_salina.1
MIRAAKPWHAQDSDPDPDPTHVHTDCGGWEPGSDVAFPATHLARIQDSGFRIQRYWWFWDQSSEFM